MVFDQKKWIEGDKTGDLRVGLDFVGTTLISTVELPDDAEFSMMNFLASLGGLVTDGPFETLVVPNFDATGWPTTYARSYETREEAEIGHQNIVAEVKEGKHLTREEK
jgi:hypothetical protein